MLESAMRRLEGTKGCGYKMNQWFVKNGNSRVSAVLLAVLCCAAAAVLLVPVLAVSFYNHPYYDDYANGGQLTKQVWSETGSAAALLLAAFEGAGHSYAAWEGNYVPNYLNSIQLVGISEELYFLVTFVLLAVLIFAWIYACKALMQDILGAPPAVFWMTAAVMVLLSVQLIPYANEAFFWQSGGVKYTMGHAFLILLTAAVLRAVPGFGEKKPKGLRVASMCILALLCTGSNLMTGMGAVLGLGLLLGFRIVKNRGIRTDGWLVAVTLAAMAGYAVNLLAPGNAVRQSAAVSVHPVTVVLEAVYASVEYIGRWTTLPWIAALALPTPFVWRAAQKSDMQFGKPLLVTAGSFAVLAAQLAPPIYTGVYYDTGRIVNTMYLSYCLFMLVNWFYWVGHLAKRGMLKNEADAGRETRSGLHVGTAVALALLLATGFAGYGVTKTTSGASAKALLTGQAARYDQVRRERVVRLEADGNEAVTLRPMEDIPLVFMDERGSWNAAMKSIGEFYGKEILDGS